MERMMASGIGPWILTTLNNWRSQVTGYPSDRRRLPASSGSNDYELLGDRQIAVVNYWSWGLCCPLEYAPGFSTWISCGPQIGMSKLASVRCWGRRRGDATSAEEETRCFADWSSCSSNMVRVFLLPCFNRLGSRAQLLPLLFFAYFPFYLFIF
jgi:hypothetical protein